MRVLYLTIGDQRSPGTRLRVHAMVPWLERRGHRVRVLDPLGAGLESRTAARVLRPFEILRDLAAVPGADVVVVYRKTFPGLSARLLRRLARRVVYEFDDAVWLRAPAEARDHRDAARYQRNFRATVAAADVVVAGNRHLAEFARQVGTAIVPTAIDLEVFRYAPRAAASGRTTIGWIGTRENFREWLRLEPVFRRLAAVCPELDFKVVSDAELPALSLPVRVERFTLAREASCLEDVDVGIMPLADDEWNRGKCSVKALQHMALGQPVVVSPVGMNREVIEHRVSGFHATGDEQWFEALLRLVRSAELRAEMGRAARSVVEQRYSLAIVAPRLVDLLEQLAAGSARSGS